MTYAAEPCVQFPCNRCSAWATAAQMASTIVCPRCATRQNANPDRMRHYSLNGNQALFGKDEWLDGAAGEAGLGTEMDQVQRLLSKALETDSPRPGSYAAALTAQTRAIQAAIALCRRQAAG